ncbi:DUF3445 domain-containing protein [Plectonema cf. radiosum LEGE 06105]|uniref:DUF3445 domain-containing protein n=1 Tax=Plectonema cf. radiosum LEGE 06105 TaxID=945769 RepID=A0A8J7FIF4_9CYAN|nr:DUF3445 domain-containing protein [Plectonema radiosum]MBE9216878.1 DUF3445 domain-containing protein [Plectonema cf. radiosum LEGE 06105]
MSYNLFQEVKTVEESKDSACYFPLQNGRYEVKPGMMLLDSNFANNKVDNQLFQIDSNFSDYRRAKLAARSSNLSKYYQTYNYSNAVASSVAELIINRLSYEYPQYFHYSDDGNNLVFYNHLTEETLYLNANLELLKCELSNKNIFSAYVSTLDALAAQIQSDIVVISRNENDENWMSAIHLCYPNHWSAEEKIGKDFATVHLPVAGIEKINQRAKAIVNTMIARKPMVRFAWGLSTDTRLNHHPEPPDGVTSKEWYGRKFDQTNPKLFLRIERQVIWGLPKYDAAIFTIRTYFRDCQIIKRDAVLNDKLYKAIESMTPESLIYKGLAESKQDILAWLKEESKVKG